MLRPLQGRRILVTRPGPAGAELELMLNGLGANCQWIPAIKTEAIAPAHGWREALAEADALLLTSKRGLKELLIRAPDTSRHLQAHCAGDGTAALAQSSGFAPGLVTKDGGLQNLVALLKSEHADVAAQIFWPSSARSRDEFLKELSATKLKVARFDFYDTLPAEELAQAETLSAFDAFLFASPSALKAWLAAVPKPEAEQILATGHAVAIGATTAQALALAGWRHIHVAEAPSNEGLLACCLAYLS